MKTYLKGMNTRGKLCSSGAVVGVPSTFYFPILPKVVIKLSQFKGWSQIPSPGSGCFLLCPATKEASGLE